ncbi:hypothetical protein HKX48_002751, partial [Thoreauomyces humboldtii]
MDENAGNLSVTREKKFIEYVRAQLAEGPKSERQFLILDKGALKGMARLIAKFHEYKTDAELLKTINWFRSCYRSAESLGIPQHPVGTPPLQNQASYPSPSPTPAHEIPRLQGAAAANILPLEFQQLGNNPLGNDMEIDDQAGDDAGGLLADDDDPLAPADVSLGESEVGAHLDEAIANQIPANVPADEMDVAESEVADDESDAADESASEVESEVADEDGVARYNLRNRQPRAAPNEPEQPAQRQVRRRA